MKAKIAIHWSWTNLIMAPLFIVPFAKKLPSAHEYIMVSNVVAFENPRNSLTIAGHLPFGMQRPYGNGICVALLTYAQQD
jgi:hypothetical protein